MSGAAAWFGRAQVPAGAQPPTLPEVFVTVPPGQDPGPPSPEQAANGSKWLFNDAIHGGFFPNQDPQLRLMGEIPPSAESFDGYYRFCDLVFKNVPEYGSGPNDPRYQDYPRYRDVSDFRARHHLNLNNFPVLDAGQATPVPSHKGHTATHFWFKKRADVSSSPSVPAYAPELRSRMDALYPGVFEGGFMKGREMTPPEHASALFPTIRRGVGGAGPWVIDTMQELEAVWKLWNDHNSNRGIRSYTSRCPGSSFIGGEELIVIVPVSILVDGPSGHPGFGNPTGTYYVDARFQAQKGQPARPGLGWVPVYVALNWVYHRAAPSEDNCSYAMGPPGNIQARQTAQMRRGEEAAGYPGTTATYNVHVPGVTTGRSTDWICPLCSGSVFGRVPKCMPCNISKRWIWELGNGLVVPADHPNSLSLAIRYDLAETQRVRSNAC